MKVLFISSGNCSDGINIIIKNQGQSLINAGIELTYYTVRGKGVFGYFKNIWSLKKHLRNNKYDIIHAHYSLSGFVAALAGCRPLVVSLMGSDTFSNFPLNRMIFIFCKFFWDMTIVKTQEMKNYLNLKGCKVIPNGVDLTKFYPLDSKVCRIQLGLEIDKVYVLFVGNSLRKEKNYILALKAMQFIADLRIELLNIYNAANDLVPLYLNSCNILLLTSKYEGSVNIIKEAMSCNCPIVATDVGDIRWIFGETAGCYITSFDPKDIAEKIQLALDFKNRTQGRNQILELGLDSETIAKKIIDVYHEVISKQKKKEKY